VNDAAACFLHFIQREALLSMTLADLSPAEDLSAPAGLMQSEVGHRDMGVNHRRDRVNGCLSTSRACGRVLQRKAEMVMAIDVTADVLSSMPWSDRVRSFANFTKALCCE
jgi:hypothetical protein